MLYVSLGSFSKVEIWTPSLLAEKKIPQKFSYFGSFFNVEIWPSPSYGQKKKSLFNVEIWPHLLAKKGLHTIKC
jgi:hypothetical protein